MWRWLSLTRGEGLSCVQVVKLFMLLWVGDMSGELRYYEPLLLQQPYIIMGTLWKHLSLLPFSILKLCDLNKTTAILYTFYLYFASLTSLSKSKLSNTNSIVSWSKRLLWRYNVRNDTRPWMYLTAFTTAF